MTVAKERPEARRVSGKRVLLTMLSAGVLLAVGVATFTALTRTPPPKTPASLKLP
jgi:hypothetical protein